MNFDISSVPFSRYGSSLAFSRMNLFEHIHEAIDNDDLVWLRDVVAGQAIFHLELLVDGKPVPYTTKASEAVLELQSGQAVVRLCIAENHLVRIQGEGAGLRLTMQMNVNVCAVAGPGNTWLLNTLAAAVLFAFTPSKGTIAMDAPWTVGRCERVVADFLPDAQTGRMDGAIEEFENSWNPRTYPGTFEELSQTARAEFDSFASTYPPVPAEYEEAARLAAYINWSCVISPSGFIKRPAMLMSKNWMCNVWSWDHCFNAMALSSGNPQMAWDQLLVMFDQQQEGGQLPDSIHPRRMITNFVKPPIHGWALEHMMADNPSWFDNARLEELYTPLARWTEWWFTYRDTRGDGLPEYFHGNDSGWDNGTVFDIGFPVKGSDLSAFLVVQMDMLAKMAERLGRKDTAEDWRKRADALLSRLLAKLWNGKSFISPRASDFMVTMQSDSVFNCLPIILGKRLPLEIRRKVAAQIRRHVTDFGPATEHPESPLYEGNGYWRGPIWAPSTFILVDGLKRSGENELAADIARRFCDMAKLQGFAENYDALTGVALCDRAYTWTSSVFLILASQYL